MHVAIALHDSQHNKKTIMLVIYSLSFGNIVVDISISGYESVGYQPLERPAAIRQLTGLTISTWI